MVIIASNNYFRHHVELKLVVNLQFHELKLHSERTLESHLLTVNFFPPVICDSKLLRVYVSEWM